MYCLSGLSNFLAFVFNGTHWARRFPVTSLVEYRLYQRSPSFLAPGTSFMEDNFPMNQVERGDGVGNDSSALHLLCTLFLLLLHHNI